MLFAKRKWIESSNAATLTIRGAVHTQFFANRIVKLNAFTVVAKRSVSNPVSSVMRNAKFIALIINASSDARILAINSSVTNLANRNYNVDMIV